MRLDSPETNTIKNESPLLLPISIVPWKKTISRAAKVRVQSLVTSDPFTSPQKKKNGTSTFFPNSCGPVSKANKWQEPSGSG